MRIIFQSIRVIDYENNKIFYRETPATFSEYLKQLINHISGNDAVRSYKTRSVNTEVISCILEIIKEKNNSDLINAKIEAVASRLLLKEREAQQSISHLNTNVQKGSLIQALLYDSEQERYIFLLANVEHTDFVDDSDFSFKSGFSKDMRKIWKTCIFEIDSLESDVFMAKVYSNTAAKYWVNDFLELEQVVSDEVNTDRAFKSIESMLNRNVKKEAPRDYTVLRNALIAYFRSKKQIDYDDMIQDILVDYVPEELDESKMKLLVEKAMEFPSKHKFDKQFNTVSSIINAKIRKVYDVYPGIQIKITDAIKDLNETINAYRDDDGNKYIKIKTNNEEVYNQFAIK
ncbi:MAG: hypothetical protein ACOX8M_00805 [Marvinbryantia sp.]|jgi:hypothetical protein